MYEVYTRKASIYYLLDYFQLVLSDTTVLAIYRDILKV